MLHPHDDQVCVDDVTTAHACIELLQTYQPVLLPHLAVAADINRSNATGAARLLWQVEVDRALMRAEQGRCFDL